MRQYRDWDSDVATEIIESHALQPGAVLPILHALQEEFGYISDEVIPGLASAVNRSRAEIHGVISFYHDFRREPPGRHCLKLCRAEACQSTGAERIASAVLARLGLAWGGTTADGALSVDAIYCLGLCACAPAALLDGKPIGRLTLAGLDRVLDEVVR